MTEYETRTMSVMVLPVNKPIYAKEATTVAIVDEAAGEFVVVTQCYDEYSKIAINPPEWPMIRAAIDRMVGECREKSE